MAQIRIPSDTVSSAGRAAHDAGLAALLGGNVYGRIAMHPALAEVSEKSERGKVVNRAWARYGWINAASLLAIALGWAGARGRSRRARTPPSPLSSPLGSPPRSREGASRGARRMARYHSRTGTRRRP